MSDAKDPARQNRLARETSPYLLQHSRNPVDWYPWGAEALAKARAEDKPIFLSIGYSACHWCHVMERESFENGAIAAFLREHFVSIKVDREERPDLDEVYMKAVQAMSGSGGWPMTVFLTPDQKPFWGGTYFPPEDRWGRPGFLSVLTSLARHFRAHRAEVERAAADLASHVAAAAAPRPAEAAAGEAQLAGARAWFDRNFDERDGGFGDAPKFPHAMDLALLLRMHVRRPDPRLLAIVNTSLDKMARGGIYDQLGGGFHRYSTDERWLIPHFEKMLYDNALLAPLYAEAAAATGEALFARVARETCDYVLRDLSDPAGGFHSAEDADSEGEEGRFYVWTPDELCEVLGAAGAERVRPLLGIENGGNFEGGTSALRMLGSEAERLRLRPELEHLFQARALRDRPAKDDKVIAEWNGLMVSALVRVGQLLDEPLYVAAAERGCRFLTERMLGPEGLLRTYRAGTARIRGFLPDYANLIRALLDLAGAIASPRWIELALALAREVEQRFADPAGGYFLTAADQEAPLGRSKDPFDNAVPAGNSIMAENHLRLAELTGDAAHGEAARAAIAASAGWMSEAPAGFGQLLQAVDLVVHPPTTVVVVGEPERDDFRALSREASGRFRPGVYAVAVDARRGGPRVAVAAGKLPIGGQATAYVCRGFACEEPVADVERLRAILGSRGG